MISEHELFEPTKNSISVKSKRNRASILSGSEKAPASPDYYLKAARKSISSPHRGESSMKSNRNNRSMSPNRDLGIMKSITKSVKTVKSKLSRSKSKNNSRVNSPKKITKSKVNNNRLKGYNIPNQSK